MYFTAFRDGKAESQKASLRKKVKITLKVAIFLLSAELLRRSKEDPSSGGLCGMVQQAQLLGCNRNLYGE